MLSLLESSVNAVVISKLGVRPSQSSTVVDSCSSPDNLYRALRWNRNLQAYVLSNVFATVRIANLNATRTGTLEQSVTQLSGTSTGSSVSSLPASVSVGGGTFVTKAAVIRSIGSNCDATCLTCTDSKATSCKTCFAGFVRTSRGTCESIANTTKPSSSLSPTSRAVVIAIGCIVAVTIIAAVIFAVHIYRHRDRRDPSTVVSSFQDANQDDVKRPHFGANMDQESYDDMPQDFVGVLPVSSSNTREHYHQAPVSSRQSRFAKHASSAKRDRQNSKSSSSGPGSLSSTVDLSLTSSIPDDVLVRIRSSNDDSVLKRQRMSRMARRKASALAHRNASSPVHLPPEYRTNRPPLPVYTSVLQHPLVQPVVSSKRADTFSPSPQHSQLRATQNRVTRDVSVADDMSVASGRSAASKRRLRSVSRRRRRLSSGRTPSRSDRVSADTSARSSPFVEPFRPLTRFDSAPSTLIVGSHIDGRPALSARYHRRPSLSSPSTPHGNDVMLYDNVMYQWKGDVSPRR